MDSDQFILIAHRGYSSKAPENTLASFWLAITSGYPQIELDVELTKDNVPVIFHDAMLDRTTDATGKLSDYSLEDISKLDDGAWFSRAYQNEKVPTLRQVLAAIADTSHLHIELKSIEVSLPSLVASELEKAGMLHSQAAPFQVPGLTITSFHYAQLQRSLELLPQTCHAWLVDEIGQDVIDKAQKLGVTQLCPKAKTVTRQQVGLATAAGFSVRGWGVVEDRDLVRLVKAGAHGATVDWPDRAKRIIENPAS